jgi:hypothetical protein
LIDQYPSIAGVGVESPPFGEQFSEGLYALFVYVNEALYLSRKSVVYFDPSTVKMLAKMDPSIRRGTMDKTDMIEAARAETGLRLNNNIADAYIIARGAARFWELETGVIQREELVPSEIQAFHRVQTFKRGARAGKTVQGGLIFREDDRFFRFAAQPKSPEEEELRQWLCRRGSKVLDKAKETESPPSLKKKARKKP